MDKSAREGILFSLLSLDESMVLLSTLTAMPQALLQRAVFLVVLLQQALRAGVVGSCAGCLPAAVVARGVAQIQLELALGVPAGVDEGDAKRPQAAVLGCSPASGRTVSSPAARRVCPRCT